MVGHFITTQSSPTQLLYKLIQFCTNIFLDISSGYNNIFNYRYIYWLQILSVIQLLMLSWSVVHTSGKIHVTRAWCLVVSNNFYKVSLNVDVTLGIYIRIELHFCWIRGFMKTQAFQPFSMMNVNTASWKICLRNLCLHIAMNPTK